MLKVALYNQKGEKKGDVTLNETLFGLPANPSLIQRMLQHQTSNGRRAIAHTKVRAEVRGGGRKPYKQKGTGNARQGSIRSAQWKGGAIIFGPRNTRNYVELMPKKQRRKALFTALSSKVAEEKVLVLDSYEGEIKTKTFNTLLKKLPISRDCLLVIPERSALLEKSTANIPHVKTISAGFLNVFDVMKFGNVLFLKDALTKFEDTFTSKKD